MIKYLATAAAGAGIAIGAMFLGQTGTSAPTCTFDGGGTIANATFATTTEGTTWVCSNGELIQVTIANTHAATPRRSTR